MNGLKDFFANRPAKAKEYLDIYMDGVDGSLDSKESQNAYIERFGSLTNFIPKVDKWYGFGNAEFAVYPEINGFHVRLNDFAEHDWETQLGVDGLTFEEGAEYRLTFDASFKGEGKLVIIINRTDDDVNWPTQNLVDLTPTEEMQSYEYYFTSEMPTNDDFHLCLLWGKAKGDFDIENIHVEKVQ